ncbi:MAG: cytochrome c [Bacteroidota bacterium]
MKQTTPWIALFSLALACSGCTGNEPDQAYQLRTDMYTQPSFRHNEDPRPPVEGTVRTVGYEPEIRDSLRASHLVNPFVFTRSSADTARILFETYCTPCHGIGAKGDGPVAAKFQTPPDLTTRKYLAAPDGYLYTVIRYGVRVMPPYDENTTARERWLILSHLRSLQRR